MTAPRTAPGTALPISGTYCPTTVAIAATASASANPGTMACARRAARRGREALAGYQGPRWGPLVSRVRCSRFAGAGESCRAVIAIPGSPRCWPAGRRAALWGYKLTLYLAATAIGWVGGAGTMSEAVHDLGALRALREVTRRGSIAAAATVLGVSQQALSARMRTLERTMNVTLLVRSPGGSHLTEQGRLIVGWADDVLDAADRLDAGLRSIRSGVSHRLAIAASQTVAEHLVPHWLVELRAAEQTAGYSPTVVELTVSNSTGVVELVRDGKAGLGFIETPHLPSDLVTEHLRDDELLVVVAPGHRWARLRRPLTLAEIARTPLVMREAGSGTRDTLTARLAAERPPLVVRIAMELGTSAAVRSAIAAGVGPGVLSRLAVRDDLVLGRLVAIEIEGPPLTRQLTAIWRPDHNPLPPEGERLLAVATARRPGA